MVKTLKTLMQELDQLLDTELYSLNLRKDTGEYHLFLNKKNDDGECVYSEKKSICGRMKSRDSGKAAFSCQNGDKARMECAKIGRTVCGTCVSHLYTDYATA